MAKFEVYFSDLTPDAQARLMEAFQTNAEEENWEDVPLVTIERDTSPGIHEEAQENVRVREWNEFSRHMASYIQNHTLEKYGHESGADLMSLSQNKPIICIWNILKYALRGFNGFGRNGDIEKITHYAQRYFLLTHRRNTAQFNSPTLYPQR